jgi:hypothetical protein
MMSMLMTQKSSSCADEFSAVLFLSFKLTIFYHPPTPRLSKREGGERGNRFSMHHPLRNEFPPLTGGVLCVVFLPLPLPQALGVWCLCPRVGCQEMNLISFDVTV